jgi:DNA-directed RNA polymerase subunit M/transcription elongation factor TFIIS
MMETKIDDFNKIREKCVNKLADLFKNNKDDIKNIYKDNKIKFRLTNKFFIDVSNDIEKGIYNFTIDKCGGEYNNLRQFKRIYMNKIISLYLNLNPKSYINNKSLISRIFSNEIKNEDLAFMTPQEIYPEHWKEIIDKQTNIDKYIYTRKYGAISSTEHCRKCNVPNTVTYYSLQTRSLDEPSTTFFICTNPKCKNTWKY